MPVARGVVIALIGRCPGDPRNFVPVPTRPRGVADAGGEEPLMDALTRNGEDDGVTDATLGHPEAPEHLGSASGLDENDQTGREGTDLPAMQASSRRR